MREFAEGEIAPYAAEWDRTATFPTDTIRKLGELGVMGLAFPEMYGGLGAGTLSMSIALEELARVDSSVAITVAASVSLGGTPILNFGTEAQKQRWLVPLARGQTIGAFASTEPGMGSDVQGLSTTARQVGNAWLINGTKAYITNAGTPMSAFVTTTSITGERQRRQSAGDQHVHRARRCPRVQPTAAVRQDGLARLGHPRAGLPGLPRPGRRPARRTRQWSPDLSVDA